MKGHRYEVPNGRLHAAVFNGIKVTEMREIWDALDKHSWNVSQAARYLGISRKTLQLKMIRYDMRK